MNFFIPICCMLSACVGSKNKNRRINYGNNAPN